MYIQNYIESFEEMLNELELTDEQVDMVDRTIYSFIVQLAQSRHADITIRPEGYLEIQEYEE